MRCKACDKQLTEMEESVNEWGELETLCDMCVILSRPAMEMDEWTTLLWNAIGSNVKRRLPLWVSHIRRSYGHLIGFEEEPYFDEAEGEWVHNEGRTYIISEFDEENGVTTESLNEGRADD